MTVLLTILFLIVLLLILIFGMRLHFTAMNAVIDALDDVSGKKTGIVTRFLILLLTYLMLIGSCGLVLFLDMIIIVMRANKK